MPLLPLYGDLGTDANFDLLVDDVCRMIEVNPVAWAGVNLDRAVVKVFYLERSLMAVYGAVQIRRSLYYQVEFKKMILNTDSGL